MIVPENIKPRLKKSGFRRWMCSGFRPCGSYAVAFGDTPEYAYRDWEAIIFA